MFAVMMADRTDAMPVGGSRRGRNPGRKGHAMALENELQFYRIHVLDMLGVNDVNEGKYIVIKNIDFQGPFDTYGEALEAGYNQYGLVPFLVKKLERNESILYFSRPI
jgi:hypothetical protein